MTKTHPTPNAEFIEANFGNEIKIMVETLKNDLSFPMILNKSNLNKLKNRLNINKKINLIGYENGELFNLYRDKSSINEEFLESVQYPVCWGTKHKECEECERVAKEICELNDNANINLLVYSRGIKTHVALIVDFNALFSQVSKAHARKYICHFCYHNSVSALKQMQHEARCEETDNIKMIMPELVQNEKGEFVAPEFKYTAIHQSLKKTHMSTMDCETMYLAEESTANGGMEQKMKSLSCFVNTVHLFEPPKESEPYEIQVAKTRKFSSEIQIGEKCIENSFKELIDHTRIICSDQSKIRKFYEKHNLSETEERDFSSSQFCAYCGIQFQLKPIKKGHIKCKNHDHISGDFINAACLSCNLKYKDNHFHNI